MTRDLGESASALLHDRLVVIMLFESTLTMLRTHVFSHATSRINMELGARFSACSTCWPTSRRVPQRSRSVGAVDFQFRPIQNNPAVAFSMLIRASFIVALLACHLSATADTRFLTALIERAISLPEAERSTLQGALRYLGIDPAKCSKRNEAWRSCALPDPKPKGIESLEVYAPKPAGTSLWESATIHVTLHRNSEYFVDAMKSGFMKGWWLSTSGRGYADGSLASGCRTSASRFNSPHISNVTLSLFAFSDDAKCSANVNFVTISITREGNLLPVESSH